MSDFNKQTKHQSISINLKLNENNNTSLQQEDFLCFGDFTKEELNIYLNRSKKPNKKFNDQELVNPEFEKVSTSCANEIPWNCLNTNKQQNNPNSAQFTSTNLFNSNKLVNIELKLFANTRKESVSYNSSKSSSYSSPPTAHLIKKKIFRVKRVSCV